ncbi:AsnC-family transcriptional regulator [Candidatus Arthromitus sp. SFB-5]|nr:AsnC-family transcriptional regulator [Candidatus Arthromitus sp. SFB-5]
MNSQVFNNLDKLDLDILGILIKDCKTPYLEIARMCHVSGGTIHVRMKKMEDMGILLGYNLSLDLTKLGFDICCFVAIYTDSTSYIQDVINDLQNINEITELHVTTGDFEILTKVICKNIEHLQDMLVNKINKIKGINRTNTFISLIQKINRNVLLGNIIF